VGTRFELKENEVVVDTVAGLLKSAARLTARAPLPSKRASVAGLFILLCENKMLADWVVILFFVIIGLGIIAWIQGEKFPKDAWFFPLLAALIMQIWQNK